jgi:hypothetical protein
VTRSAFLLVLLLPAVLQAGWTDSLSIRFGGGLSRPFVEQRVRSSIPGADFSRDIPALFTAVVDVESALRQNRWEGALVLGVDGEVLSVNRLDATGFSIVHLSLMGGARLLRIGPSQLWMRAGGGLAIPALVHDEAASAEDNLGWRVGSGLAFVRGGTRVVMDGTLCEVSFRSRSRSASSTSEWRLGQLVMKVQWDWI